ncbi:GNAT family N-acetyltransferase [Agrilactobacillus fermenti]|uniref:GNAT family N-acetyltransferase n=1 Tax=Agrilactobacillus fermenti TaxID=2586909 RepID=UPI003A5C6226
MNELTFRTATFKDLATIVAIYNESIPGRLATADTEPLTVAARQPWFTAHQQGHQGIWVAVLANKIVGWFSFSDFYGRPAYKQTKEISIYLTAAVQHQHLGQKVLTFAETKARQLGLETIVAFIFKHNQPSVHLFKKNHYQIWGDLPDVAIMDQKHYSLLILGKQLTPSVVGGNS